MGGYFPDYSIYLAKMEYVDRAYYIKNCSQAGCWCDFSSQVPSSDGSGRLHALMFYDTDGLLCYRKISYCI